MFEVLCLILGIAIGAAAGWFVASSRLRLTFERATSELKSALAAAESSSAQLREQLAQQEDGIAQLRQQLGVEQVQHAQSETRLVEVGRQLDEQRKWNEKADQKLREAFESLSVKALRGNAEQFLNSAKSTLETLLTEAKGDLGKRQEAINTLVKPLADSLKRYEEQVQTLEQARQKAYGSLEEQVKALASTNMMLQQETGKLVTSLRDPKVRGRWGEMALRRAAELAGMSEHCDFEEQAHFTDIDGTIRPDMLVHLPGKRVVVVDAKAVLDAYLDAVASTDEPSRQQHLGRHAAQIRSRIRELSGKSYWDRIGSALHATPEFVVLFLPGESFFSAAVEMDRSLIEDAIASRVVLASPTTLIALLRAVAFGWRQEQIAENAERISQLGREVFERMRTLTEHIGRIGGGLSRAVSAYNSAVASLESRVLPSTRKFRELGAASGDDLPELAPLDCLPREVRNEL